VQTVSIFTLVGASHCVLLAFVCYLQSASPKTSDKLLTTILVFEGLRVYSMMAISEGSTLDIWSYGQNLRLAVGPLFYLYTLSMIDERIAWKRTNYLHFLPALLLSLLMFINEWTFHPIPREHMTYLTAFVNGLVFISYGIASRKQVLAYKNHLKRTHSAVEQINLNWLKWLGLYIIFMGIALVLAAIYLVFQPAVYSFGGTIIFSTITTMALCYVISLKGIQQSRVYERLLAEELERYDSRRKSAEITSIKGPEKYETSAMTKEEAAHFYQLLLDVMKNEQLYLRPKLKLADLADEVGLHPQQASQVINQCAQLNFYDFVNNYRIEEAIKLLQEDKLSILDIGAEAGFNSSATFYKHFRRQTGKSPKRYIKEQAA
jgi:AraC-like DNA-binding protein